MALSASVLPVDFDADEHAELAETVGDGIVDIGRHDAVVDRKLAERRSVMFSPIVAIASLMVSATDLPSAG